jgi:hypothetical protein
LAVAVLCALGAHSPACFADFIVDLQAPTTTVNGSGHTIANFTITLQFDPTGTPYANQKLAFFAIDITDPNTTVSTSPQLTNGGTYAAFSFALDPGFTPFIQGKQAGWSQSLAFGNGSEPGETDFGYVAAVGKKKDFSGLLGPGTYTLGVLSLDLTVAGVTADPSLAVGLVPTDLTNHIGTAIGVSPATGGTLTELAVTFNNQSQPLAPSGGGGPTVPAPPSLVLFAVGGALFWVLSLRYRVRPRLAA